jgi:hypothetical protein
LHRLSILRVALKKVKRGSLQKEEGDRKLSLKNKLRFRIVQWLNSVAKDLQKYGYVNPID